MLYFLKKYIDYSFLMHVLNQVTLVYLSACFKNKQPVLLKFYLFHLLNR